MAEINSRPISIVGGINDPGYRDGLADQLTQSADQTASTLAMLAVARAGDALIAFHNHDEAYLERICGEYISGRWTYERWETKLETELALALADWRRAQP